MVDAGTKKAARTAIQKIARTYNIDITNMFFATVNKVDKTARTCDVTPITGKANTKITDVSLQADSSDGELKIPSIDSTVVIAIGLNLDPFVFLFSDIDEISWKSGNNAGLVNVNPLKAALNNLQAEINTLKNTLSGNLTAMGIALASVDGGTTTAQAAILSALQLPQINLANIENTKIKHGDK